jgi:hypothetical protein
MLKFIDLKGKCKKTYPRKNRDIDIMDYENLVNKVFNSRVKKFGGWVHLYREEMVQEGFIGLMKAKEKYQPGRGSFLGLAWLRISKAMNTELAKFAKYNMNTKPIDSLNGYARVDGNSSLNWEDLVAGDIIDYEVIIGFVSEEDDKKLLHGIIEMYPYWKLRAILGESKAVHEMHVEKLKVELLELLDIVHPNSRR